MFSTTKIFGPSNLPTTSPLPIYIKPIDLLKDANYSVEMWYYGSNLYGPPLKYHVNPACCNGICGWSVTYLAVKME